MMERNDELRYGRWSIRLHWLGAATIVAMLATAAAVWFAPDRPTAVSWLKIHGALGVLLYLLLVARIAWHFMQRQPAKLGRSAALNRVATLVHATLLVLIAAQLITGPIDIWSGGWPIDVFGLFGISSPFGPGVQPWHDEIGDIHRYTGYAIAALVALHIAAVAKHTLVDRDGTLGRMLGLLAPAPVVVIAPDADPLI